VAVVHTGGETHAFAPRTIGASVDDLALGALAASQSLDLAYLPRGLAGRFAKLVEITLGDWRVEDRELYAVYPATLLPRSVSRPSSLRVPAILIWGHAQLLGYRRPKRT
jgi:hypothetical protein